MAVLEVSGDGLQIGADAFKRSEIEAVKTAVRLYDFPLSSFEKIRSHAGRMLSVVLGHLVHLLFILAVVAMIGSVFFALGDSLGFSFAQASPFAIPVLVVAAFFAWQIGQVMRRDVSHFVARLMAVPQQSLRYYVLAVELEDRSQPLLASSEFRAVEDLRINIADRLETPAAPIAYTVEIDMTDGTWVGAEEFTVEGDHIRFSE